MRTIFPPFPYLIWKVSLGWELFLFILWDTSKAPREIKVYSCRETKFATLKSLWHEDYFKLETIKPKRLRKKCWPSPIDSSGLPWWLSKESACQCRRHRFNPLVRETSWRRKQQPTPVFLPWEIPWTKEPGRLQSMGHKESDTSEHVRTHAHGLSKECRQRTCSRKGAIVTDNLVWARYAHGESSSLFVKILCVPLSLLTQKTFIYLTFAFPPSCQLPSSLLRSQTIVPNILFFSLAEMVFKVRISAILMNCSIFLGPSDVYMLLNFCVIFSCKSVSCQFTSETRQKNLEG